jgi:AP endonuclease-1
MRRSQRLAKLGTSSTDDQKSDKHGISDVTQKERKQDRKRAGKATQGSNKRMKVAPNDKQAESLHTENNGMVTAAGDVKLCAEKKVVVGKETMETRPLYLGAHVSIAGGLENAVHNAVSIGANCFGLFLRSQRQWNSKPLEEATVLSFKAACEQHGFLPNSILPHGSYLLNLGSPDEETRAKSKDSLVDEMTRCQQLGIILYNFHPGSTCGKISVEDCTRYIADGINLALSKTERVTAVIENMCCQGGTVGGKFEELRGIIDLVNDKSRIGVCLDTCHAFAAGNDLRTKEGYEKMMSEFDDKVGLQFLRAIHLNDSMGKLGCHLDRHENIGKGKIGLQAFRCVVNDPRLRGIPMILETPAK